MSEVITLHKDGPVSKSGFCPTPTAQSILHLLSACQAHGLLGAVIGEPGTGKSTAIAHYVARNRNSIACRMSKVASKQQPGLLRIAEAVGSWAEPHMGAAEVFQLIGRRLASAHHPWGSPLLILDEAQHMDDELLETVRDLWDEQNAEERRMGLVLVGNPQLAERWGDGGAKRRKFSNFRQLKGRIGPQLALNEPRAEDIGAICAHHGIEGARACKVVASAAAQAGGLHNVGNLVRVATELAGAGKPLALGYLEEAAFLTGVK